MNDHVCGDCLHFGIINGEGVCERRVFEKRDMHAEPCEDFEHDELHELFRRARDERRTLKGF